MSVPSNSPGFNDWSQPAPRRPWAGIAAVLAVALILGGAYWSTNRGPSAEQLARVSAEPGRLTLEQDDGGNLTTLVRRSNPDAYYRVDLKESPLGFRLQLLCEWVDPAGHVAHQNSYTTKTIDKAVWPTHAHFKFGPASPLGQWTARLSLAGRTLSSRTFSVADAADNQEVRAEAAP